MGSVARRSATLANEGNAKQYSNQHDLCKVGQRQQAKGGKDTVAQSYEKKPACDEVAQRRDKGNGGEGMVEMEMEMETRLNSTFLVWSIIRCHRMLQQRNFNKSNVNGQTTA